MPRNGALAPFGTSFGEPHSNDVTGPEGTNSDRAAAPGRCGAIYETGTVVWACARLVDPAGPRREERGLGIIIGVWSACRVRVHLKFGCGWTCPGTNRQTITIMEAEEAGKEGTTCLRE